MKYIFGFLFMLIGIVWGTAVISENISSGAWWNVVPFTGLFLAAIFIAWIMRFAIEQRADLHVLLNMIHNFTYLSHVAQERADKERYMKGLRAFTLPPKQFKRLCE